MPDDHHCYNMAEVGAALVAFEVVETALQGAAVGALAVSKSTVPLHCRFHKIESPSPSLGRCSHSLNIIKGKAYVYGGESSYSPNDGSMDIMTLPSNLDLRDVIDYQSVKPEPELQRPLAAYSDTEPPASSANSTPQPRAAHASTSVDSMLYIFSGRQPNQPSSSALTEDGTIHCFSTTTNKWTALTPHPTRCTSGVPCPRTYPSLTSTPHPLPSQGSNITPSSYGTLFLHGGYDSNNRLLRDVWTFDISSRVWTSWPSLPEPGPEDVAGDGQIVCIESRLWRVGDGFGKMYSLAIVRDDADDGSGKGELGVSLKSGEWEVFEFGATAAAEGGKEVVEQKGPTSRADELPLLRKGAGFVPITTGAGREYLLYFMGEDAPGSMVADMWSFQVKSDKQSLASVKDTVRSKTGFKTGENVWARAEVPESSKNEGILERPQGLSWFAADQWKDIGAGAVVLWGGKTQAGEVRNEGWIITVD